MENGYEISREERDHLEDLGVDWIILKWILGKYCDRMWNGLTD
jgi:hypothetical protein